MTSSRDSLDSYQAISGFEGLYEINRLGSVRSLTRKTLGRWGKLKTTPGRQLRAEKTRIGYMRVELCKLGKRKKYLVHRLVMQTFAPASTKPHVNHKDDNKENNALANLEWCTPKENTAHAMRNGHWRSKLKLKGDIDG